MKQQLTKEQSRRLIELGVPADKASSSVVEETQGNGCSWTYPVFTIGDLLEVLPKDEYTTIGFRFLANTTDERCNRLKNVWCAEYDSVVNSVDRCFYSTELINALFDLVVLCIENGHIKTGKL